MAVFSKKMFLLGNDNIGDEVELQLEKETPLLERTSPTLMENQAQSKDRTSLKLPHHMM